MSLCIYEGHSELHHSKMNTKRGKTQASHAKPRDIIKEPHAKF